MDNFILKIALMDVKNPRITRTLSCPGDMSFHDLHKAIIIAFGWALVHQYTFKILHQPAIPGLFSPTPLHEISDHEPEDLTPSIFRTPVSWSDSNVIKIHEYITMDSYRGKPLQYQYDPREKWKHSITYVGKASTTERVLCIDGEGHGPAEDAGGVFRWEELKEAYRTPNPNERQLGLRKWYEDDCTNGFKTGLGGERIWRWDQDRINRDLMRLPKIEWKHDRDRDA